MLGGQPGGHARVQRGLLAFLRLHAENLKPGTLVLPPTTLQALWLVHSSKLILKWPLFGDLADLDYPKTGIATRSSSREVGTRVNFLCSLS